MCFPSKNTIASLHTYYLESVAGNGKCIFLLALVLTNLFVSPVEAAHIFRLRRTLHVFRSPMHYQVETKVKDQTFKVYWNSPTIQCQKYGILLDDLTKSYGIRQNTGDSFRGGQISILYDPGNFPALLKKADSDDFFYRNGGVPQEGSLQEHIDQFKAHIEQLIPDGRFNGIGVIDFESWRPIFRQNFGSLQPYKDVSYDIERKKHMLWPKNWIEKEAAKRFEEAGIGYMKETLQAAKEARPLAKWGYYAYPYCFNMNGNTKYPNCPDNVKEENNKIQWLWDESDALFPSVYLRKKTLNPDERMQLIKGRMKEAQRIAANSESNPEIYPYIWYKYQDNTNEFLTKDDLYNSFDIMKKSGVSGAIIWGSSNDVNNKNNCLKVQDYIRNVLGPVVSKFISSGRERSISENSQAANQTTIVEEFVVDIR